MPEIFDWPAVIQPAAEARLSVRVMDAAYQSPHTGQMRVEQSLHAAWVYELSWPVMDPAEGHAMELLLMQLDGRINWARIPVWHQQPQAALNFTATAGARARVIECSSPPPIGSFFNLGESLKRCISAPSGNYVKISPLVRQQIYASPATTVNPYGTFRLMETDVGVDWEGCAPSCDLTFVEAF